MANWRTLIESIESGEEAHQVFTARLNEAIEARKSNSVSAQMRALRMRW